MKTQKVYNADTRELYGEFDIFELVKLRIKYVRDEIKEKLCYIDENNRMYKWDEFATQDEFHYKPIDCQYTDLIRDLLKEQLRKRANKRNEPTTNS